MHLQNGGPKKHCAEARNHSPLTREMLVENTKIVRKENDFHRLERYESLIIQQKSSTLNG